jgi:hypothetical protein
MHQLGPRSSRSQARSKIGQAASHQPSHQQCGDAGVAGFSQLLLLAQCGEIGRGCHVREMEEEVRLAAQAQNQTHESNYEGIGVLLKRCQRS